MLGQSAVTRRTGAAPALAGWCGAHQSNDKSITSKYRNVLGKEILGGNEPMRWDVNLAGKSGTVFQRKCGLHCDLDSVQRKSGGQ